MLVVLGLALVIDGGLRLSLMGDWRRAAIVTTAFMVPALLFGVIVELKEPGFVPGRLYDARGPLVAIAVIVAAVCLGFYLGSKPRIRDTLTQVLNVISICLSLASHWFP